MLSNELTKGTLKTIVLKLLDEEVEMYGYEITQHVKSISEGKMILTEGALYPTLHKLVANGLLKTNQRKVGKRMRKYYSLTPEGKKATINKLMEFHEFVQAMQMILKPKPRIT